MLATRLAWSLAHREALKRETQGVVGLTEEIIRSDKRLRSYILENIGTYCHALGTARHAWDRKATLVLSRTSIVAFGASKTFASSMRR